MNVFFKGVVIWLIDINCFNGWKRFVYYIFWLDLNKMWFFYVFLVIDSVWGMSYVGVFVIDFRFIK